MNKQHYLQLFLEWAWLGTHFGFACLTVYESKITSPKTRVDEIEFVLACLLTLKTLVNFCRRNYTVDKSCSSAVFTAMTDF